jgi:hypothetical protein
MIYEEEMIDDYEQDYVSEQDYEDVYSDEPLDMTDVEADADTLANIGWGTDEDYNHYEYDHLERDWDEQYIPDNCDD